MYKKSNEWTFIHASLFDTLITTEKTYRQEYTTKNIARVRQVNMWNVWVTKEFKFVRWQKVPNPSYMPEFLKHYKDEGEWIRIPQWLSSYFVSKFKCEYSNKEYTFPTPTYILREEQSVALDNLLFRKSWLLHASTGTGKTVMMCETIKRCKRKSLIVVQNLTQMKQMVKDVEKWTWLKPITVSWKKMTKKEIAEADERITVCSIDSRDKLNMKDYGCICLDESDTYFASDDRRDWLLHLSPEYLYAFTGTVKVNNMDDSVFKLYYWPKTELLMKHYTPEYIQVATTYTTDIDTNDQWAFVELESELYSDEYRNDKIAWLVWRYWRGRKSVVFCKRVEHAKVLADKIEQLWFKTYILIWEVSDKERERIRMEASTYQWDVVLVGSVKILGRWFDLPELSLWLLTTAETFSSNLEQYVWRIIRKHEWKKHPLFIDMIDICVPMLDRQSKKRKSAFTNAFPDGNVTKLTF